MMSLNKRVFKLLWLGVRILHVRRNASGAVGLDKQIVRVHLHVEESVVSPVGAPRIATDPILLTILVNTVAND